MRIQNVEFFRASKESCDTCDAYVLEQAEEFKHERPDCDGQRIVESGIFYWTCSPGCLPDSEAEGPFTTEEEAMADAVDNGFLEDEDLYTHVVDLDERGEYKAHVENWQGDSIFEYSNLGENGWPSPDGLWLVTDGFMKHTGDLEGLEKYLKSVGILHTGARIE